MKQMGWIKDLSLGNKNLYYKLTVAFGLFFLLPSLGFLYFFLNYNLRGSVYILLFFITFLVSSLLGLIILRKEFERIQHISTDISKVVKNDTSLIPQSNDHDELNNIIRSFYAVEGRFRETYEHLVEKVSEVSVLKELSDLCYITSNPDELLYVTLERALKLMKSDIGSVLVIEEDSRHDKSFIVKATIGLGDKVKVGDRIDYETSIAKYAVINKSPLVVGDVESDDRFGRLNRPQYGSKSFISMPIKAMRDIIGVLNISKRNDDSPFSTEDIDVLTPLLSNAAFTYENIRLRKEGALHVEKQEMVRKLFKILGSSLADSEMYQSIFNEIKSTIPFRMAILAVTDENKPDEIIILDFLAAFETSMSKGSHYKIEGSVIDRVYRQGNILTVDDIAKLSQNTDKDILGSNGGKTAIIAPLRVGGAISGVLIICMEDSIDIPIYREYMKHLAGVFSLAVEKNKLSFLVAKRSSELDTIKQIGSALASSTFEMTKVLQYTMDMIKMVVNVEEGSLFLLDGKELECKVALNMDVSKLRKVRVRLGQGIAGYVAALGETVRENNVKLSSMFDPTVDAMNGSVTRAVLCVPIISQGRVIGVIEVINKIGGNFGVNDQYLLQSIASSVSIAIENARLYQETLLMAEQERGMRQMFQKFVPEAIVDKIVHGIEHEKGVIEELRTLTFLNIDIRGFSVMAMEIGSQKTVALLNYFFSTMGEIVFANHGIVDKYLGDGFLALFGAPISSYADADNAINAALEMQNAIREMNEYFNKQSGMSVTIGVSIHTGEAVVGNIGFEKKMDYTVIGESVNTVFRLQEVAKTIPNGIVISDKTLRAAQSPIDVREIKISRAHRKRVGMKVKAYELTGLKSYERYTAETTIEERAL